MNESKEFEVWIEVKILNFYPLQKVVYHFMLKSANYKKGHFKAKRICAKT